MCEVTTLCFHAQTDRQSRICSCRSTRTCSCPWPFWYKTFFSDFPRTRHGDRSDSWDAFLCHGSFETFDGIIPRSILAVYPEEVANDKIIPYKNSGRRSVPDITRARTAITAPIALTSTPTLSTIIGVVPDFICHKWSQRLSSPIGVQCATVISWSLSTGTISKRRRWHDETD